MPIDASAVIAPTARIHPEAIIGPQAVIGEYCVVEADTQIGAFTRLEPYVYVKRWTTLGQHNEISAGTALGTDPLDKNFTGARSYLRIGNANRIREHYTISRGTAPESETVIGDSNYIMTSGHIAHNARIGNNCVIASTSLVAGYVLVEDGAFISGGCGIHQYSRIGRLAMVGGSVRVNQDALPFCLHGGLYIEPKGLNLVGLKRSGVAKDQIRELRQAYKLLFQSHLSLRLALDRIEAELPGDLTRHLVAFIRGSKRGIPRPRRVGFSPSDSNTAPAGEDQSG
jgi:UDP-N-acetylglucosamine acyltransferase